MNNAPGSRPAGRMVAGEVRGLLDLAMGTALIVRHLILPLAAIAVIADVGQASAQGAFPAPLPNQATQRGATSFPPAGGGSPFPPVNGAAPGASFPAGSVAPLAGPGFGAPPPSAGPSDECMKGFIPLREEAEKRAKMIRAASERHATPEEACKLFVNFGQAEIKMVKFVESHAAKCGIPPQVSEQIKTGHKNTEGLRQKVCAAAQQQAQRGPAGPSLSEALGSAAALPEATPKKQGGSTFDTLSGNVLAR
jgi:hypothetical protein